MPTPSVISQGVVLRQKPSPNPDGVRDGVPFRAGRYGEEVNLSLVQKSHVLADEGSYFVVSNPTPGTGIASAAAPTGVPAIGATDTKPFFVYQNTDSPSNPNGKRTYFDYIRFRNTAAGTNGTAINFTIILDAAGAARAPSGGSVLTNVNCNMDDGTKSIGAVSAGAVTVATTSSGRLFPNIQLRPVIPVVGDIYVVSFGGAEYGVGSLISSGTTICQQSFGHPPLIIGPGGWFLCYLWLPSQSAASSYELDAGFWER